MCGTKRGTPMPVVTSTVKRVADAHAIDAADARAGVGENLEFVAGLRAESFGHPRSHTTRAVAADFRD